MSTGALTVSFAREIPGFARQHIGYSALPAGAVVVFSRWQALKDIEVAELVDHPFRWVEIEKFISKPEPKQTAPGLWTIDGKLQVQIASGSPGEVAKDGLNGAVRRGFSAKAGEVMQDSVCVYQAETPGHKPAPAASDAQGVVIGEWRVERGEDGRISLTRLAAGARH